MRDADPAAVARFQRLVHFTPLRYPGGKGKLAAFVKDIIEINRISDGEYVEPYAGGAAIALELLFHEYVSRVHINDISRPVFAFWKSVLYDTENFVRRVHNVKLNVGTWDRQKRVLANQDDHDDFALGFATFLLNRTNRSGILNGGIIGGRDQSGLWKIDARFNRSELIHRIESVAKLHHRIVLTREDAYEFLVQRHKRFPSGTLIYLDPPYYSKGKELYYDYYNKDDHKKVAALVRRITKAKWIVSYDDVKAIREMYTDFRYVRYTIGYSAREIRQGNEVMFFCDGLKVPALNGAMRSITVPKTGILAP
jgi:DNA adenine methylase